MAGYIGSGASVVSSGAERKKVFDITTNTTSLTGLNYTVGKVHVYHNGVRLVDGTDYTATNSTSITLTVAAVSGDQVVVVSYASYQVALSGIDDQSNATAITIDSNENVLIGTTDATPYDNTSGNGILLGDGLISSAQSGGNAAIFNRMTNDGSIVNFRKDGTSVGSIQSRSNQFLTMEIGTLGTGITGTSSHAIIPSVSNNRSDNTNDLGSSVYRWKDAYIGGGIYLGGVGAFNKLDDYERGNWTPVFAGSSAGTYTYGEQQGHYVKIGAQVTCWFNLTNIATVSAGSGLVRITGLPFTINWISGFNGEGVGTVAVQGFTGIDGKYISPRLQDGVDYLTLYHSTGTNNGLDTIDAQDKVDNLSDIRGCVTYNVAV